MQRTHMTFADLKNAYSQKDILEVYNIYSRILEQVEEKIKINKTDDIDYLIKRVTIQKQIYELAEQLFEELQNNFESDEIVGQMDELERKIEELSK